VATNHASYSLARRTVLLGALATGMLAMAASTPALSAPREVTVRMANMSYGRIPADLKVGDTIVWVNGDTVPHSVTARDKSFDLKLQPKQTAKQKLSKAGTIQIICTFHPTMRGTLKVAAS
jgi:plastocyanin